MKQIQRDNGVLTKMTKFWTNFVYERHKKKTATNWDQESNKKISGSFRKKEWSGLQLNWICVPYLNIITHIRMWNHSEHVSIQFISNGSFSRIILLKRNDKFVNKGSLRQNAEYKGFLELKTQKQNRTFN